MTVDQVSAQLRAILDAAKRRKLTSGERRRCDALLDLLWRGVLCHADAVQAIGSTGLGEQLGARWGRPQPRPRRELVVSHTTHLPDGTTVTEEI